MIRLTKGLQTLSLICFISLLGACATTPKQVLDGSDAAPGSLFSKLELEMGISQVQRLIGRADDSKRYPTAKKWLPYYYGTDSMRQELFYRSEGRLIFGGNQRLIKIVVDVDEDGFQ